ncbi:MAG: GIN domain-containing protein, partial [Brevefilum sp.]
AGSYQAGNLQSYDARIEINGLGSAVVWAADTLQVSINGAGSVDYYGSPQLTQEISGLGNVNKLGDK